jgi:hypothetical protein
MRKITEYFQVVDGSSTLAWREEDPMDTSSVNAFLRHGNQESTRTKINLLGSFRSTLCHESDHLS